MRRGLAQGSASVSGGATHPGRRSAFRVAVCLAVVCGAAGCGSSTLSPKAQAQQQAFLNDVHQAAPDVGAYRTDLDLTRLGKAVCDDLSSGASYETVADRLATTAGSDALPSVDLGAVISSAAMVYCPQYADRVS